MVEKKSYELEQQITKLIIYTVRNCGGVGAVLQTPLSLIISLRHCAGPVLNKPTAQAADADPSPMKLHQ